MQFFQGRLAIGILQSKLFIWCTLPILLLGILILTYFVRIKDFPVFPNSQNFEYKFYSDNSADSNTKIIRQLVNDSIIQLDYQISNKTKDPYAGVNVGPKGSTSIDLGHYNQLTIKLKGDELNGIGITLVTQNFLKVTKDKSLEILFYHIFKISPGFNTYRINTNKFQIPDWWGENNRIEDASTIAPDLRNLEAINVSGAFTTNNGKMQSIEICSMAFSRNNKPLISIVIALEFVFILLIFLTLYIRGRIRENKQIITINYKPIDSKDIETPKSDFIEFINKNFHNSQLTLEYISQETGVSPRKITVEIQTRFDCNLKTYINRLRMSESKRLLIETDFPIGEITYRVGFNNQTHFNRVFKAEMQISPSEYRSKNKK